MSDEDAKAAMPDEVRDAMEVDRARMDCGADGEARRAVSQFRWAMAGRPWRGSVSGDAMAGIMDAIIR